MIKFEDPDHIRRIWDETFHQVLTFVETSGDRRCYDIIGAAARCFMNRQRSLFKKRILMNRIKDGHGDLRCEHVYFHEGIQIIDCIEFRPGFRLGDAANDLAFLAMDLDFHGHSHWARRLLDTYMERGDDAGLNVLIDFYKCYRALVRLKVAEIRRREATLPEDRRRRLQAESRRLLALAGCYALRCSRPAIWMFCGLPASGKSSLARVLGDTLGIAPVRSDHLRGRIFPDRRPTAETTAFGEGFYTPAADRLIYDRMLLAAREALEQNESVFLDATFRKRGFREEVRRPGNGGDVLACRSTSHPRPPESCPSRSAIYKTVCQCYISPKLAAFSRRTIEPSA